MHPLDLDPGGRICRPKAANRISTVVADDAVEPAHREHEGRNERDDGAARDDQPVRGAQSSDMVIDMFEDIEGDETRVTTFGWVKDIERLHPDPWLISKSEGESL